jgi:hypothetical protein
MQRRYLTQAARSHQVAWELAVGGDEGSMAYHRLMLAVRISELKANLWGANTGPLSDPLLVLDLIPEDQR